MIHNPDARFFKEQKEEFNEINKFFPENISAIILGYVRHTVWDETAPPTRYYDPPHKIVKMMFQGELKEFKIYV